MASKKKRIDPRSPQPSPIGNVVSEELKDAIETAVATKEGPIIRLGGDDVALVLRATGRSETYLRSNGKEREQVTEGELLLMALSFFLGRQDFVEMIKAEYLKMSKGRMENVDPKFDEKEERQ